MRRVDGVQLVRPFGPRPALEAVADDVDTAFCAVLFVEAAEDVEQVEDRGLGSIGIELGDEVAVVIVGVAVRIRVVCVRDSEGNAVSGTMGCVGGIGSNTVSVGEGDRGNRAV